MHPILSNRRTLLLYLGIWFIIGLFVDIPFVLFSEYRLAPVLLFDVPMLQFIALVCLSSYYLCRTFPLRQTNFIVLLPIFLLGGILVGGLCTFVAFLWGSFIDGLNLGIPIVDKTNLIVFGYWGTCVFLFLLVASIHYIIIAFEESRENEQQALEMKLYAQDAELRALRAQINPHFLFNSLNSINALTMNNPEQARTMTVKLADFFRQGLKLGALESISLKDELSLIDNFLEIEKVRFGSRLHVEQHIDPETLTFTVPPLILQPLVENAVRHGIAQLLEGGTIIISSFCVGDRLRLRVQNPADRDRIRKKGIGMGLKNVRQRLDTLFGTDSRVDVEETNDYFSVELLFPCSITQN